MESAELTSITKSSPFQWLKTEDNVEVYVITHPRSASLKSASPRMSTASVDNLEMPEESTFSADINPPPLRRSMSLDRKYDFLLTDPANPIAHARGLRPHSISNESALSAPAGSADRGSLFRLKDRLAETKTMETRSTRQKHESGFKKFTKKLKKLFVRTASDKDQVLHHPCMSNEETVFDIKLHKNTDLQQTISPLSPRFEYSHHEIEGNVSSPNPTPDKPSSLLFVSENDVNEELKDLVVDASNLEHILDMDANETSTLVLQEPTPENSLLKSYEAPYYENTIPPQPISDHTEPVIPVIVIQPPSITSLDGLSSRSHSRMGSPSLGSVDRYSPISPLEEIREEDIPPPPTIPVTLPHQQDPEEISMNSKFAEKKTRTRSLDRIEENFKKVVSATEKMFKKRSENSDSEHEVVAMKREGSKSMDDLSKVRMMGIECKSSNAEKMSQAPSDSVHPGDIQNCEASDAASGKPDEIKNTLHINSHPEPSDNTISRPLSTNPLSNLKKKSAQSRSTSSLPRFNAEPQPSKPATSVRTKPFILPTEKAKTSTPANIYYKEPVSTQSISSAMPVKPELKYTSPASDSDSAPTSSTDTFTTPVIYRFKSGRVSANIELQRRSQALRNSMFVEQYSYMDDQDSDDYVKPSPRIPPRPNTQRFTRHDDDDERGYNRNKFPTEIIDQRRRRHSSVTRYDPTRFQELLYQSDSNIGRRRRDYDDQRRYSMSHENLRGSLDLDLESPISPTLYDFQPASPKYQDSRNWQQPKKTQRHASPHSSDPRTKLEIKSPRNSPLDSPKSVNSEASASDGAVTVKKKYLGRQPSLKSSRRRSLSVGEKLEHSKKAMKKEVKGILKKDGYYSEPDKRRNERVRFQNTEDEEEEEDDNEYHDEYFVRERSRERSPLHHRHSMVDYWDDRSDDEDYYSSGSAGSSSRRRGRRFVKIGGEQRNHRW